ncbi:MAG: hypothetical protein WD512_08220 [Candidatus Paceibacterota bacterium]
MTSLVEIANDILGDNFYIEDSMGMLTTEFSASEILQLADTNDSFEALDQLEEIFYRVYQAKFPRMSEEYELRLVYSSDGTIHIAVQK